jgi:hypothetical protein
MYRLNVVHACIVSHLYTQVLRMYCLAPALAPAVGTSLPVCGSLCARATAREPAWREQRRVYERRGALKTQGTRRGAAARRAEQTMEMAYAADGMRAYWSAEVQLANIKYMQLPDVPCPAPCCHKPPLASTQGARYKAPVTRRPLQGARYKAPVTRRPLQGARYKATKEPFHGAPGPLPGFECTIQYGSRAPPPPGPRPSTTRPARPSTTRPAPPTSLPPWSVPAPASPSGGPGAGLSCA